MDQREKENEHRKRLDMSEIELELDPLPVDTPNQSLLEDIHESSRRQLPNRLTRGIPKATYESRLSSKIRYPMNHYMSTHHFSQTNQSFVNQLSIVSIPNSVQEALAYLRWKTAMNKEMVSL